MATLDVTKLVHEIVIKRNKEIEKEIIGEIQNIAIENGVRSEIVINEKFVTQAITKANKRKVIYDRENYSSCPNCKCSELGYTGFSKFSFCPMCGQALDWED